MQKLKMIFKGKHREKFEPLKKLVVSMIQSPQVLKAFKYIELEAGVEIQVEQALQSNPIFATNRSCDKLSKRKFGFTKLCAVDQFAVFFLVDYGCIIFAQITQRLDFSFVL
jgi:hypothetical protein